MEEYEKIAWLLALYSQYERGLLERNRYEVVTNKDHTQLMFKSNEIENYCIYDYSTYIRVVSEYSGSWEFVRKK